MSVESKKKKIILSEASKPSDSVLLDTGDHVGEFVIEKKISSGSFGAVYSLKNRHDFILKAALLNSNRCTQLRHEYTLYQTYWATRHKSTCGDDEENELMAKLPRVVMIAEFKVHENTYSVLILQRLDRTVVNLPVATWLQKYDATVAFGHQLIRGLQFLHQQCRYTHGDLKLENMMMTNDDDTQLYLIDFGLSKKIHPKIVKPEHNVQLFCGNPRFASVKTHEREYELNAFDDIESVLYILCTLYLGTNKIHWIQTAKNKRTDSKDKRRELLDEIGEEKKLYAPRICNDINQKWLLLLHYLWKNCRVTNFVDYDFVLKCLT